MLAGARAAHEAALRAANVVADLPTALAAAADAWCDASGGTSGALWAAGLRAAAASVEGDASSSGSRAAPAAQAALDSISRLGAADLGDKTMLDALAPFVTEVGKAGWTAGARAAARAAEETASLRPRIGRARPLAERSIGHPDPGATSLALCAGAAARVLESDESGQPDG